MITKRFQRFFNGVELTNSQTQAVERLDRFLSSDEGCFILKGYAGTGKTFLLEMLSQYLNNGDQLPYYFVAPTGRATKVIRKRTKQAATTIHSMIYELDIANTNLDIEDDAEYKLIFKLKDNENLPYNAVILVDEASMVSDKNNETESLLFGTGKLLTDFFSYINLNNTKRKVVFIGDNAQLPPVNSRISPALQSAYLEDNFNLTATEHELVDVFRQEQDSGVLKESTLLRQSIKSESFNDIEITENQQDMIKQGEKEAINMFVRSFHSNDEESAILIAQTNKLVNSYNQSIREQLGYSPSNIHEGERLLVVKNTVIAHVPLFNGDFVTVERVNPVREERMVYLRGDKEPVKLIFRKAVVSIIDSLGNKKKIVWPIYENLLFSNSREMSKLEMRALLVDFKNRHPKLKPNSEQFQLLLRKDQYVNALNVKFGYAITCHKSQGGEWRNVWVDFTYTNSIHCEEYFRWAYTAMTRTKEHLFLVNPPQSKRYVDYQELTSILHNTEQTLKKHFLRYNWKVAEVIHHPYQVVYHVVTHEGIRRVNFYYNLNGNITSTSLMDGVQTIDDQMLDLFMKGLIGQNIIEGIDLPKSSKGDKNQTSSNSLVCSVTPSLVLGIEEKCIPYLQQELGFILGGVQRLEHAFKIQGIVKGEEMSINCYHNKQGKFTKLYIEKGKMILSDDQLSKLKERLS